MARPRKMPQRLPRPALNRGRVQIAARRAAIGREVLTTSDVVRMAYCRKLLLHGRKLEAHDYRLARRALKLIAEPIGRSPSGMGRPMLWWLRNSGGE